MGDKRPRQLAQIAKQRRRAAAAEESSSSKRAAASPDVSPTYSKPLRFRFNRVDLGGPWCLSYIDPEDHRALIDFMAQVESMTVAEVIPAICKREDVAGDSPNRAAQERARGQYAADHERLHVLHLSGERRLWGLMFDNEFSVTWWDPRHEVWPSAKRNT